MEFTGSELMVKRNFFTQTGNFSFGMACTVDNTTGTYHFGVSGSQGAVDFTLQSGKVYYQDQFVHSYRSNQDFLIEAQFSSGKANVTKDSSALTYGVPSPTGQYDYFYFNRANASLGAEFTLRVSGETLPLYTITDNGYIYSSGQGAVTGYFVNQSLYPIRVFDSDFLVTQPYDFGKLVGNISPALTGVFTYTGDFDTFDLTQPILTTFNTNFGDQQVFFNIVDLRSYSRFIQFQDIVSYTFDTTGTLSRDLFYSNYSGGFITNGFNAGLSFQLSYVSGSGVFPSTSVSGFGQFKESGLLTGLRSGNFVSQFSWATGSATGVFSGIGTGWSTGLGYTGLASGLLTGLGTGFIFNGSGTLTGYRQAEGSGFNIAPTGGLAPTVYAVGPYTGIVDLLITGSGIYQGQITGATKTFTGSWNFLTGTTPGTLVSLKQAGQYNSLLISGSGFFAPNSQVSFQITHNIIDTNPEGCRLIISGNEVLNPISQTLSN